MAVVVGLIAVGMARRRARRRPWNGLAVSSGPAAPPSSRLPPRWRARLARALTDAGVGIAPEEAVMLGGAAAVLATIVAWTVAPELAVLVAPVALLSGPTFLWTRRHRRGRTVCEAIPELLDEVARELRAGGAVAAALDRVAVADADHVGALASFRDARLGGTPAVEALERWVRSHDDEAIAVHTTVAAAAGALATALAAGGPSAYALEGVAEALRAEVDARAEVHAQGAQGRASAAVLAALAPASLGLGAVLAPESARVLLVDPIGNAALVAGVGCEALGVWWMRRILSVP